MEMAVGLRGSPSFFRCVDGWPTLESRLARLTASGTGGVGAPAEPQIPPKRGRFSGARSKRLRPTEQPHA